MQHAFLPSGEHVRRAVRWISDSRLERSTLSPLALAGEAAIRFDLSPFESEWLVHTFGRPRESTAAEDPRRLG
jgi:hypothetical protein